MPRIEQARLEQNQNETEEQVIEHFKKWANNPRVREAICGRCLSPEQQQDRMREIFGLAPIQRSKASGDSDTGKDGQDEESK